VTGGSVPRRPFRDSAIFYGVLAAIGFGFLLLTGQDAMRAAFGAGAAFLLATSWSWWRFARAQDEERNR
jgi:threonine/homoserine/homoserine lactone efflux protein